MTPPVHQWEQWEGTGFPSDRFNSIVYYYPGKVDIEDIEQRNELAIEIHRDGIVPDKRAAHALLETAIVTHGQVEKVLGELSFSSGADSAVIAHDATWVELDEYSD